MSGNGLVNFTKACKGMTLLGAHLGYYDGRTVFLKIVIYCLSVNYKRHLIRVDGKCAGNLHITGGHGARYLTPARECVSFLLWLVKRSNGGAKGKALALYLSAVHFIYKLIYVHCICGSVGYIAGRDSDVNLTPSRKRVPFLGRCVRRAYLTTVFLHVLGYNSTVSNERNLVHVFYIGAINCHIMIRHGFWKFLPSRECIPFPLRNISWGNTTSNRHQFFIIFRSI